MLPQKLTSKEHFFIILLINLTDLCVKIAFVWGFFKRMHSQPLSVHLFPKETMIFANLMHWLASDKHSASFDKHMLVVVLSGVFCIEIK